MGGMEIVKIDNSEIINLNEKMQRAKIAQRIDQLKNAYASSFALAIPKL